MKRVFRFFISIICVAILAISLLGCETSVRVSFAEISATKFQSELARDYKKIFDKDFIQKHMNGLTVSELISSLVEKIRDSEDENAKDIVSKYGMFLNQKYFVNDLSTYNWLATITVQLIKKSLNEGTMPQDFIDNVNNVLPLFGMSTINIDLNKHDYTDKDAEEIALKLYPLIDRIADEDILRELGIDLDDPDLINKVIGILASSGTKESEKE